MKKTIPIIVMAMLCLIIKVEAQETTKPPPLKNQAIIGKIVSSTTGEALPGAVIKITTPNHSIVSNDKGEFVLTLNNGTYNISVTHIGYKTKAFTIHVPLKEQLVIPLDTDDKNLQEVEINAGYYTVKDRERTGSISRVTAETIGKQPVNNFLQTMQGRVSGVEIVQKTGVPGGAINVRIRGQNSISNGNEPLYVVNGVPVPSKSLSSAALNSLITQDASPLSSINTADIESIEILKDADATAIYGSRGANGVVLITTKMGSAGLLKLDVNLYQGYGKVSRKIDFLNTEQYIQMRKEAFKNDNATPGAADYDINGTWDQTRYTDWQKELIGHTATTSNAHLSLSAGNANTTFLLSGNYYRETTVYPGDNAYQKGATLLNVNHVSTDQKFKVQGSISYNLEYSDLPQTDLTTSITLAPNAPPLWTSDGKLNFENPYNPAVPLERKYTANTGTIIANTSFGYRMLKNLELSTRFGYTRMQRDELLVGPLSSLNPSKSPTANSRVANYVDNWSDTFNIEPQLTWNTRLGPGKLNFMTGATIQQNRLHTQTVQGTGYVSDGLLGNIFAAGTVKVRDASNATYRYLSVYGRINYNLDEKYLLNITGRRDGSSRFGKESTYANFGAIGVGWIFSSFSKLRGSYGITGNDQIGDYNYLELWKPSANNYQAQPGLQPSRLSNPNYSWETNKKAEVALELGFLNDALHFTLAYYRNRSSNQLVNYTLAPSTGFSSILSNLPATVQNTGWEFDLAFHNSIQKAIKWSAYVNLSVPRNKLIAFPNLDKTSYGSKYAIGKPLTMIKALQYTGVDKNTGLYTYTDFDGSGTITSTADAQFIKTLGQDYAGGFQNVFTYKRIELDFLFQFVKQVGRNYMFSSGTAPGEMSNQPIQVLDRWQQAGDETNIQKYTISSGIISYAYGQRLGDFSVSNASFIRLKNLALSYRLVSNKPNMSWLKNAKVYLQAQNLITITNYLGTDPEAQLYIAMPPLRMISFGLQFTL